MNDGKRTMSNTFHPVDVNHPLLPEKAREFQMFINGKWTTGHSSESFVRKSPAHDIVVSTYPAGTVEDVDEAVKAARDAFDCGKWSRISGAARAAVLLKTAQLIRENLAELALLETLETGKPIAQSRGEIQGAADIWEYAAGLARSINGDSFNNLGDNMLGLVTREPIGVVGVITPWNFPFFIGAERYPYILAAGCTLVAKAAEITSGTTLLLAGILKEAGLPDGVFNVVTGSAGAVGNELTSNPLVRKLSFTGSTEIGRQLMEQCAKDIKKVSLELGGNAPFIVFDDADLDKAVEGALASKFRNAGQTCVCANRLYVQDGVYDRFAEKLQQAVEKLRIGDGLQDGVTTGPLIDDKAVAKVEEHIADALAKGARIVTGGKPHALGGNFFQPTILVNVPSSAKVAKEETFGPLAPLFRFKDEADVIAQANDTEFGLAAYFYARDLSRVFRVGEALEYGIVGINTGIISNEVAPFGGIKASGLGREGSKYGIEDYLEIKYMCIGL